MDNDKGARNTADELDDQWVESFRGRAIPEGAVVTGFISVIDYIDTDGEREYKVYTTLDNPLSEVVGLLEMAKADLIFGNFNTNREVD